MLSEIGEEGQARLKAAKVLVIGAGGLGSPVALYLAAAGIGTLGLADFDKVELHNLQRQILHGTSDIDRPKTQSGADRLAEINPHTIVIQHTDGVTAANAVELFRQYDLIVDGSDNFPTRYLNTDASFFAKTPLVYGSIFKFEGQVTVFDPHAGGPCYRCLFPEPPPPGAVPNCGEAGVLGALCGVVGSVQAMETIKRIAGVKTGLGGRLLVFDALATEFRSLNLRKDPDCPLCSANATILDIDPERYAEGCAPASADESSAETSREELPLEVDCVAASRMHRSGEGVVLDVREPYELNVCRISDAIHVPMRQIPSALGSLPNDRPLLVVCHHGIRSMQVTQFLRANGHENVTNVRGGIDAWAREVDTSMQRY